MSLGIRSLEKVKVLDSRVDLKEDSFYSVLIGSQRTTQKREVTTNVNSSTISWSIVTPSPKTLVDRKITMTVPLRLTFTGDSGNPASTLLQPGFDSPRQYPLSSIINTIQLTINNSDTSLSISELIHPLMRYQTSRKLEYTGLSTTATMKDYFQSYDDGIGTVKNPLAPFYDNSYELPRASVPMTIVQNDQFTAIVDLYLTEPLFISPLTWGEDSEKALFGVQQLNVVLNLNSDLTRAWSHAPSSPSTINSVVATLGFDNPYLDLTYMTPKLSEMIPMVNQYPWYNVNRYITELAQFAAGQTTTVSSQNIQLSEIPTRMYIFVRRRLSSMDYTTTDTFFRINSISVNYNNQAGLFSGATTQQLYQMSVDNGLLDSYPEFYGSNFSFGTGNPDLPLSGSVLCLQFGKDIGLADDQAPGLLMTQQLQIDVNVTNVSAAAIDPSLYIVIVSEGTLTIMDNRAIYNTGVLSREDIMKVKSYPEVDYQTAFGSAQYGGNFFSSFKRGFAKLIKGAKKLPWKEILKTAATLGPLILSAAGRLDDMTETEAYELIEYEPSASGGLQIAGRKYNMWVEFLKMNSGRGLSRKQLVSEYRKIKKECEGGIVLSNKAASTRRVGRGGRRLQKEDFL